MNILLDFFMSAFGDNLKAARLAKGMTLVQCASALGVTNPALSQWEQGKREPKHSMLVALCRLLDTTPNDLLGVEDVSPRPSATNTQKPKPTDSSFAPQCAKCPHRKLAEKMRKMLDGG